MDTELLPNIMFGCTLHANRVSMVRNVLLIQEDINDFFWGIRELKLYLEDMVSIELSGFPVVENEGKGG